VKQLITPAERDEVLRLCGYGTPADHWRREDFDSRRFMIVAIENMHAAAADKTLDFVRNIAVVQAAGNSPLMLDWRVALCEWMTVNPGPELQTLIEESQDG
jgi:hypothetical protein